MCTYGLFPSLMLQNIVEIQMELFFNILYGKKAFNNSRELPKLRFLWKNVTFRLKGLMKPNLFGFESSFTAQNARHAMHFIMHEFPKNFFTKFCGQLITDKNGPSKRFLRDFGEMKIFGQKKKLLKTCHKLKIFQKVILLFFYKMWLIKVVILNVLSGFFRYFHHTPSKHFSCINFYFGSNIKCNI